jgi:Glycosyl hydrolases family 28
MNSTLASLFLSILLAPIATTAFAKPVRQVVFDVRDFGAAGDGATLNTAAIQKAIDACTAAGGGEVLVAGGRFVTGTIYLKDNVELHIASGTVLLGSTNIADYATDTHKNIYDGEPHMDRCLIFARGAANIALTGDGMIDGQGEKTHFPNPGDPAGNRPMLIRFLECTHLRLRGLTLRNPASWTSAWLYCRDIVVDGITIESRDNVGNGDGLDFDGCENVRVSNCSFDTSDDSICLQASRLDRPCRNVVINNCVMQSRWAAIRIGMSSLGDLQDVTVSNCIFHDIRDAGLKIQMCEGGTMKNMLFSNIIMRNVPRPLFMTFNQIRLGVDSPKELPPMKALRDIRFSNIRVDNSELAGIPCGFVLSGVPGRCVENIVFDNISLTLPGGGTAEQAAIRDVPEFVDCRPEFYVFGAKVPFAGFYARYVRGLTLSNVRIDAVKNEARPAVVCETVTELELVGTRMGVSFGGDCAIRLRKVKDARIRDCSSPGVTGSFVRIEDSPAGGVIVSPSNRLRDVKSLQESP